MNIGDINIGLRARKDLGDIAALAKSIETHGLLHPIVVKSDNTLVAGERRIRACESLGWTDIPARVIDVADLLSAERDENNVRKDFTPSEAVAIGRLIEDATKEQNKEIKRQKISAAARAKKRDESGHFMACQPDGTNLVPSGSERSQVSASAAVGLSHGTYYRARKVVEAAETNADEFGDLVETMDQTGQVHGAYSELKKRQAGKTKRHAALRKMHYPKPNREVERAVNALAGICDALRQITIEQLDSERTGQWSNELKKHSAAIAKFARSLT